MEAIFLAFLLFVVIALFVAERCAKYNSRSRTGGGEETDNPSGPAPDYPWMRLQRQDVREALEELSKKSFTVVTRRPYVIKSLRLTEADRKFDAFTKFIAVSSREYWESGWISDYYNEKCRIECRRYDSKYSLKDAWDLHGREIAARHPGDLKAQAEALYEKEFGCNSFRPDLVVGAVKFLNLRRPGADAEGRISSKASGYPARMIDFSAGWGDRLIGAIAAGIDYLGVDPNPCTWPGYQAIIKDLGDPARHRVIKAPFEEVPAKDLGRADLVMTSPPYFDLEEYSQEPGQSILSYPGERAWLEGFLYPSLRKCWEALRPSGTLILVINDKNRPAEGESGFTLPARDHVSGFPQALYRGILPYTKELRGDPRGNRGKNAGRNAGGGPSYAPAQPMFVWLKVPDIRAPAWWFSREHFSGCVPEWIGADLQEAVWDAKDKLARELEGPEGLVRLRASRPREMTWKGPAEVFSHAKDPGITLGETLWLGRTRGLVAYAPVKVRPNPPFVVETHENLKIIRDDLLPGGTKQRGHAYLRDMEGPERGDTSSPIVYAGTYGGFCHVAYAVSCWFHKRPLVVFLARSDYPTNILAKRFGAVIIEIAGAPYPALEQYAKEWAARNGGVFVRGLYGPEYEKYLVEALREHPIDRRDFSEPLVFWLGATSAMLAKALSVVYPRAYFNLVHLGKHDYNEDIPAERFRLWEPTEDFLEPARVPPPYPSVALYEAKVWDVARKNASAEDYIWSTGAE